MPSTPTIVETLRVATEFLRSHLFLDGRCALEGEEAQHQMEGPLRFLSLIGYYLVNFVGVIPGASALELVEVKEIG